MGSCTSKFGALFVFLAIIFAAGVSVYLYGPPDPRPENAPPSEFSAVRAQRHLEAYAKGPHRAGTDANYAVRDYIVTTLQSMGAEPEVTEPTIVHEEKSKRAKGVLDTFMQDGRKERGEKIVLASPQNILARIPGTAPTKAFLFMAHYDSVPFGPGASDDGSGVASMLEMYRVLKAGQPLKNDVIFLFTDGEECGLWGPKAFLEHEWCKDTGMMLNFEARGTNGPSNLFETSSGNGWLIQEIAKAAPYPAMSSMMFDFYDRTPFASDFEVLKETIPGMNIAWIGNFVYYHTMNDNARNISLASLQHHGSYAESLVRHFGNMPLDNVPKAPDAVYFNTLGTHLVYYAPSWARVFAVLIVVFFAGVLVLGFVKKRLSVGGMLCGALLLFVTAIAVVLVNGGALGIGLAARGLAVAYDTGFYIMAFVFLTFAIVTRLHRAYRRRFSMENLAAGAMLWWAFSMVHSSFIRPNVSFLPTWPLLISAVALGLLLLLPEKGRGAVRVGVLAVSGACIVAFFAPLVYTSALMLIALGGPLIMILVVFMFGLLVPHVEAITGPDGRWIPRVSALLGLALLGTGILIASPSENRPRWDCVTYAQNADTGEACWVSSDKKPDEWTSQFFPPDTKRGTIPEFGDDLELMKTPAPMASLPAPDALVISDDDDGTTRTLHLRITSPRGAARMILESQSDAEVQAMVVNSRALGKKKANWRMDYSIFPRPGIDVIFEIASGKEIRFTAIDYSYSLSDLPDIEIRPRPPHLIPQPNTTNWDRDFQTDMVMVRKSFTF